MRKTVVFLALFTFVIAGCTTFKNLLTTPGEWSENYALDLNGGRATSPEMNDGSAYTGDKTKPLSMGIGDENWQEKEKFTQASVTLKEPKQINKVKILSKDLDNASGGMEAIVEYIDEEGNWKELKAYQKTIPKNISIVTNIFTDKIRLKVRRPSSLFSGGGGTGGGGSKDKGERTITEFEVYGKVQVPESQKEAK